jgi:hypothetical protein
MDDHAAVSAAKSRNVTVRRSLGLLCNGLHKKTLTMENARSLVDELASFGGARFPCDGDVLRRGRRTTVFSQWHDEEFSDGSLHQSGSRCLP